MNFCGFAKAFIGYECRLVNKDNANQKFRKQMTINERKKIFDENFNGYLTLPDDNSIFKRIDASIAYTNFLSSGKKHRNRDRGMFLDYFCIRKWNGLSEESKLKHTFRQCKECETEHGPIFNLHTGSKKKPKIVDLQVEQEVNICVSFYFIFQI